jgi:four helix bundle protein
MARPESREPSKSISNDFKPPRAGSEVASNASLTNAKRRHLMKGDNIYERLVKLGVEAVHVVEALPSTASAKHIGHQLMRSATSAGANYQEARGAESRNDFAHKLGVALKELHETHYWLRLLAGLGWVTADRLERLLRESWELSRILASSIRTAKAGYAASQAQQETGNRQPATENRQLNGETAGA